MTLAAARTDGFVASTASQREWATLAAEAPLLVAVMGRFLGQLGTFLAPRSVEVADITLRQLARWLVASSDVTTVAAIGRAHIEDYKLWLAHEPGPRGTAMATNTQRHRLRMIRSFFERIIEWDWPEAPQRNPIFHGDIPARTDPLPKFLDDQAAAKLMAAARAHRIPRYRLVIEMLARTGLRASELCQLDADAVTLIGHAYWLRVPVGKLRNDRFIPLHGDLVVLLAKWTADNSNHIRAQHRLLADDHSPIDRRTVHRIVGTTAKKAGLGTVHPHQLHHTLATRPSTGDASRSHRGAPRAPLHGNDPHLRPHRRPGCRRRIRRRLRASRRPLQHRRRPRRAPRGNRDRRHDPPA